MHLLYRCAVRQRCTVINHSYLCMHWKRLWLAGSPWHSWHHPGAHRTRERTGTALICGSAAPSFTRACIWNTNQLRSWNCAFLATCRRFSDRGECVFLWSLHNETYCMMLMGVESLKVPWNVQRCSMWQLKIKTKAGRGILSSSTPFKKNIQ